jgi:anti-sigma factor RsiW
MNCQEAIELIEQHLDGEISESDARLLREHVGSCRACGAEFALAVATDRVLSDSGVVRAPARLDASVAHEIVRRAVLRRHAESLGVVAACVAAGAAAAYGVSRALDLSAAGRAVGDAAESVRRALPGFDRALGEAPDVIAAWSQDPSVVGVALACAAAAAVFLAVSALRAAKQFSPRRP